MSNNASTNAAHYCVIVLKVYVLLLIHIKSMLMYTLFLCSILLDHDSKYI